MDDELAYTDDIVDLLQAFIDGASRRQEKERQAHPEPSDISNHRTAQAH